MNDERKWQRLNRKMYIDALDEVLVMLNRIDTRVELANETMVGKKYLVFNGGDKVVLDVTAGAITIGKYCQDVQVKSLVVHKDGVRVRAKAWLLEFNLESATEKPLVEKLVEKLKNRQYQ